MKYLTCFGLLALGYGGAAFGAGAPRLPSPLPQDSVAFIENKGQWNGSAQFLERFKGLDLWLTSEGPVYDFYRMIPLGTSEPATSHLSSKGPHFGREGDVIKVTFDGARPAQFSGVTSLEGKFNYFQGERSQWATGVRRFGEASSTEIYDGIHLRYYVDNGLPRYDIVVRPGADPSQLSMRFEGAKGLRILADGSLSLQTSLGAVQQRGLFAFQPSGEERKQVPCRLQVVGNSVRFVCGSYDRTKPLVIDPLLFSTFIGGSANDGVQAVKTDSSGDVLAAGATNSADFPVTPGAYSTAFLSTFTGFIVKLSPDGRHLLYGSFVGGGDVGTTNYALGLGVDSSGNAVLCGLTSSPHFPLVNPIATYISPRGSAFVSKVSANGSSLLFSTVLTTAADSAVNDTDSYGNSPGVATNLVLGPSGNAFIVGYVHSKWLKVTANAYGKTYNGTPYGTSDGFLLELSPGGALLYGSYIGGTGRVSGKFYYGDQAIAVDVDASGETVVLGRTSSSGFLSNNGTRRGFLLKLTKSGSTALYGLLLEPALFVASMVLDPAGRPIVAGNALKLATTQGVFQPNLPDGKPTSAASAAILKISADGTKTIFETYCTGSGDDYASSVTTDIFGDAIFAGGAQSSDFPITSDAVQSMNLAAGLGQLSGTCTIAVLSSDGGALLYGTYLGGGIFPNPNYLQDLSTGICLDPNGNPVIAGQAASMDFPTTDHAFDTVNRSTATGTGFVSEVAPGLIATLIPEVLVGGSATVLDVKLNKPAGSSGASVALATSNSAVIPVPAALLVPAGKIYTGAVVSTRGVLTTTIVTVIASYLGVSKKVTLTVNPAVLMALTLSKDSVKGGTNLTGTVSLNGYAPPGGGSVRVGSSNADVADLENVAIVPYDARSVTFNITTHSVTVSTTVTIQVLYRGLIKSMKLTVTP